MALKKCKPTTSESNKINSTNYGLNNLFLNSQSESNTYNSPISYFNKDNNTNENEEMQEEIQEVNEPMKYESKDDITTIKRTSKTSDELKKLMKKVIRKERKVLTIDNYEASVSDVLIEEVIPPKSEKYYRVRIRFEVLNDEPVEFVKIDVIANLNLNYNSKLSRLIRGITGKDAGEEFDLTSLRGKKVLVRTKQITDKLGNLNHAIDTIEKMD